MKFSLEWLLKYLNIKISIDDIKNILPKIGFSILGISHNQKNIILNIEIPYDRPDCLSYIGMAKEISKHFNGDIVYPFYTDNIYLHDNSDNSIVDVQIQSKNCYAYSINLIPNIKVQESPDWIKQDLLLNDYIPKNNIIDIINWVMLETGHPLHAFDYQTIKNKKIYIRETIQEESFIGINNKNYNLNPNILVTCDDEKILSLSGIMGAKNSMVNKYTKTILIENGYFNPHSIIQTSKKLNLYTHSSILCGKKKYFYKKNFIFAFQRVINLIQMLYNLNNNNIYILKDMHGETQNKKIIFNPHLVKNILGIDIKKNIILNILQKKLKLNVDKKSDPWIIKIEDDNEITINNEQDILDQIIKIYGIEKIEKLSNKYNLISQLDIKNYNHILNFEKNSNNFLINNGFIECYNDSLYSDNENILINNKNIEKGINICNYLSTDHKYLRSSLIFGLLNTLIYNKSHGNKLNKIFETGNVFQYLKNNFFQVFSIGFIISDLTKIEKWIPYLKLDCFFIKNLINNLMKFLNININNYDLKLMNNSPLWEKKHSITTGSLIQKGYKINYGVLSFDILKKYGITPNIVIGGELLIIPEKLKLKNTKKIFKNFNNLPCSTRDITLLVHKNITSEKIKNKIEKIAYSIYSEDIYVEKIKILDVFQNPKLQKKSVSFSLFFKPKNKKDIIFTEKKVTQLFDNIQDQLKNT